MDAASGPKAKEDDERVVSREIAAHTDRLSYKSSLKFNCRQNYAVSPRRKKIGLNVMTYPPVLLFTPCGESATCARNWICAIFDATKYI